MFCSIANFPLQFTNLLSHSTEVAKHGPPLRDQYTFFIGPDRTKFTIHTQLFNLYAPNFHEDTSSWPNLSPHATKIAFEFCTSRYLGYISKYDVETLRTCFDVYNCADAWGIQSLKIHVCQVICASNILAHVDDYGAFLAQLYQFYVQFSGKDQNAADALTKCLRTITKEHSLHAGARRGALRNQLQTPSTRDEEMQDILSTEFARLDKDCRCRFCKYQRAHYKGGRKGPFWAFRIAKADLFHDSKVIWTNGLTPIGHLFDCLFNTWIFAILGWLLLMLGTKTVVRESIRVAIAVLAYLLLLVVVQCALLLIVAVHFLFDQAKPLLRKPAQVVQWIAWKIAFPPTPRSMRKLLKILSTVFYCGCALLVWMSVKILIDYRRGNGPFDQLTKIIMLDNPELAWTKIYQYYMGWSDPGVTSSWVRQFEEYLEMIEKGQKLATVQRLR
ncbi:uncharacterized protein DFL_000119 [Arthrobotrys flagrans]|uniref:BTB domain-containing protein n=1 Tax=Arthrobotrys flagrans TaxID=97331 RepID=A0A437ADA2_ARTFL|nr:hypothetical protein DFL_000119 [Arthrobotrys flagrans]